MERRQPRVAVLGAGSWGTAVASIIARSAPTMLWARSPALAEEKGLEQGTRKRMTEINVFAIAAGMGDLVVTCTRTASRNRRVGEELGKGRAITDILADMNQVAEGVKAARVVMEFAADLGVDMPIATEVDAVLNHGATALDAYRGLLRAAPGHELHGEGW